MPNELSPAVLAELETGENGSVAKTKIEYAEHVWNPISWMLHGEGLGTCFHGLCHSCTYEDCACMCHLENVLADMQADYDGSDVPGWEGGFAENH
jgi:hypothetical protein